jgi:glycosyltransferase involved in cell wall biosynthesis
MRAMQQSGCDTIAVSPRDEATAQLQAEGFNFREFPLDAGGTNIFHELKSVRALRHLLRRESADIVFSFTPKANIYTGLATLGLNLPHVPTISGLGKAFIKRSALTAFVKALYRLSLGTAFRVLFQNENDREEFIKAGIVDRSLTSRTPGSGVDLTSFRYTEAQRGGKGPVFLMVARMLQEKGVNEFVHAARDIRNDFPDTRFVLLGATDVANPSSISRAQIDEWVDAGSVEYAGQVRDVRPVMAAADCVVLPSYYREGVPRSLLEAAAMAKPVITTDMPGCRDAVDDGSTGFLCRPRDTGDLTAKIRTFLSLSRDERNSMGIRGRLKMQQEFDERLVIDQYFVIVRALGHQLHVLSETVRQSE